MAKSDEFLKASAITLAVVVGSNLLVSEAVKATARLQHLDLFAPTDQIKLLPLTLPLYFATDFIRIVASAGLFSMALFEAKGSEVRLEQLWIPATRPFQFAAPAALATVIHSAATILLLQFVDRLWLMFYLIGIELFAAPFYVFIIPLMLERGAGFKDAAAINLQLASRRYFQLMGLAIGAFFQSIWGVFLLLVGYIWTQPNYQREVIRGYTDLIGLDRIEEQSPDSLTPRLPDS
ncbi:MAG: hypothetical protein ACAH95_03545 [Fimbriimonas sp.]